MCLFLFMLDQHNSPEAARAEGLESLEVLKACCVLEFELS